MTPGGEPETTEELVDVLEGYLYDHLDVVWSDQSRDAWKRKAVAAVKAYEQLADEALRKWLNNEG